MFTSYSATQRGMVAAVYERGGPPIRRANT